MTAAEQSGAMTTTDVREAGGDLDVSEAPLEQRGHHRGRRWILAAVAFVVLAGALGYLVGNEVQANTQFDQAHHSLDVTRIRIARVDVQLASVRRQLTGLQGQVTQDSATLAADTNKLNSAKVALADAEANNSRQNAVITDLDTCLGGVEEALNALSVGDQSHAVAALDAVSASCDSAVAADG